MAGLRGGRTFFSCRRKAEVLEENTGHHDHERMVMKAVPGAAFKVVKTEFFQRHVGG